MYKRQGQTLAESQVLAQLLEEAGVDVICCAQGGSKSRHVYIPPYSVAKGSFAVNAAAIKAAVSIPVMANGRIVDPEMADLLVRMGQADLIAMGRATLADPELPNKVAEQRASEVRRCLLYTSRCV